MTPDERFSLQLMQASCQRVRQFQVTDFMILSFGQCVRGADPDAGFGQFHQNMAET
jgi:hypothetical protein